MKPNLIILGAGTNFINNNPSSLQQITLKKRVLDIQLEAFKKLNPNVFYVGGFEINSIIRNYPSLKYDINQEWERTGSFESFLTSIRSNRSKIDNKSDLYICYSDILFKEKLINNISTEKDSLIKVVTDELKDHKISDENKKEKILLNNKLFRFVGLIKIPKKLVNEFIHTAEINSKEYKSKHISKFISEKIQFLEKNKIQNIRVTEEWAHLENINSIARFSLGTKASTLDRLKNKLNKSIILDLFSFTREDFIKDRLNILQKIKSKFRKEEFLIIRSSAKNEDQIEGSNAGRFKSLMNISLNDEDLERSIIEVFDSYNSSNVLDEILVQPQLRNVKIIGVIFSRDKDNGSPYININYSEDENTTVITSGSSKNQRTLKIARNIKSTEIKKLSNLGKKLYEVTKEIEEVIIYDSLDIEFAVLKNEKIVTLQVRPLSIKSKSFDRSNDQIVEKSIDGINLLLNQLNKKQNGILGNSTIYSVMADWNPAEIIGLRPSPLALDLYKELITNNIWSQQRYEVGYRDIRNYPLIRCFGGHAFIDVRASLNSFIPKRIDNSIAEKIIRLSIKRLKENKSLHDKIEFEIIPTCIDFNFNYWEKLIFKKNSFNPSEIKSIKENYISVTNQIIEKTFEEFKNINKLNIEINKLKKGEEPFSDWLCKSINICKDKGTLSFAHLARAGFVAASFIKSAVEKNIITKERSIELLKNIYGIGKMLTEDACKVKNKEISKASFIKKYGHLRPGTYDIKIKPYHQNYEQYLDPIIKNAKEVSLQKFKWSPKESKLINSELKKIGININADKFLSFIEKAIYGREYSKFTFTKLVSLILDKLTNKSIEFNIDKNKIDCMPISFWINDSKENWGKENSKLYLQEFTEMRYRQNKISELLTFPTLISDPDEVYFFITEKSEPSFITNNIKTSPLRFVYSASLSNKNLRDCIVAIENADPGYDYLFAMGISGLITAFGGPNSHMAIRASEFNIPAVMGVGKETFNRFKADYPITINCISKRFYQEA